MVNYENLITFFEKISPNSEEIRHFKQAYHAYCKTGKWEPGYQVYTSEWLKLDGAMLMTSNETFDADYRVYIAATTERSLRELLLAFPRHKVGRFAYQNSGLKIK